MLLDVRTTEHVSCINALWYHRDCLCHTFAKFSKDLTFLTLIRTHTYCQRLRNVVSSTLSQFSNFDVVVLDIYYRSAVPVTTERLQLWSSYIQSSFLNHQAVTPYRYGGFGVPKCILNRVKTQLIINFYSKFFFLKHFYTSVRIFPPFSKIVTFLCLRKLP